MTRTETPQRNSSRPSSEFGQAYFLNTGAGGAGVADGSAQLGLPVQEGARLSDCSVERRLRPATASRKAALRGRAAIRTRAYGVVTMSPVPVPGIVPPTLK